MIEIDGGFGEGGGQILRSSLSLSALTGKPVRVFNIRAGRRDPGLKPQHLAAAMAAAQTCGGKLEGARRGSTELRLYPAKSIGGNYRFNISEQTPSAGATTLVLQTVLWPLGFAPMCSQVVIQGGTHVAWSPTAEYFQDVFCPTIAPMGISLKTTIRMRGFYPVGGGALEARIEPFELPLRPLTIHQRGPIKQISLVSYAAGLPRSIAERQFNRAQERLAEKGLAVQGKPALVQAPGKGTFCFILVEFEHVRAGFSALGEIGKPAEQVADEATDGFLRYLDGSGALDPHLADQLVLPMALARGESSVTILSASDHLKTNLWVMERFLKTQHTVHTAANSGGVLVKIKGTGLDRHLTS